MHGQPVRTILTQGFPIGKLQESLGHVITLRVEADRTG